MDAKKDPKELIVSLLKEKSDLKQRVFDITLEVFNDIKVVLKELVNEINGEINGKVDDRVLLEYYDKGTFEVEMKIAGDILVFNMHTNVFDFPPEHSVKQISYFEEDPYRSFSGIISIYNFLADSIKFNRYEDLGYLIGRIFINKDRHYMVEGKRQLGLLYRDYHLNKVSKKDLKNIVLSAILYTLDFDLLVPPYDSVSILTVRSMLETINKAKMKTGKRLGFKFYPDSDDLK
jgi:hypothetical protein